jgi:predicted transposase YdaD
MRKPFDATLKGMLEASPPDWAELAEVPAKRVEVVDADVSTVTAATDKVLRVDNQRILHYDFQTGPDARLPRRTHGYSALLEDRHYLPAQSIVVLLRPEANLRTINGVYTRTLPGEKKPCLAFRYKMLRVWQLPVKRLLAGVSLAPLAPIGAVRREDLPRVIEQMDERFAEVADRTLVAEMWTATGILMGLRYEGAFVESLLQGVVRMEEESAYYQYIVTKTRLQDARRMLLQVGEDRLGAPPNPEQRAVIEAFTNPEQVERLVVRTGHVSSWAELLSPPRQSSAPHRRSKKS